MTIIAACTDPDGSVWMGADTISVYRNDNVRAGATAKVFQRDEMLIGSSGTVRCHQIVEHLLPCLPIPADANLYEWLVKEFSLPLRAAMKEHGGECKTRDGGDEMDARLLLGVRGRLFSIDTGYGVYAPKARYDAIGCADQEALAAMFTVTSINPESKASDVVQAGLDAAAEFDLNIRPPFDLMQLPASSTIQELSVSLHRNGNPPVHVQIT